MKLNARQKAFCEFYVASGNATESAVKAGYSEKYAGQNSDKLLKNTNIQIYIEELNKKVKDNRIADIKEVKEFWTEVLRNKNQKTQDRLKASEYIAKTNGAFLDKVEVKGELKTSNPFSGLTTEELKKIIKAENKKTL